jgi:hypothetical protein
MNLQHALVSVLCKLGGELLVEIAKDNLLQADDVGLVSPQL